MTGWLRDLVRDARGYFPESPGWRYMIERGIPCKVAAAAGVGYLPATYHLRASADFVRWADRGNLRDRLVFPFSTADGQYIGVQTRSLSNTASGKDRYQNYVLPAWKGIEAPMFHAEHAAPVLHARDRLQVVLVEGPMDVLAVRAVGEHAVIASHTAAIPAVTVEWIRRWSNSAVLALLDMDRPGREGVEKLLAAGLTVAAPPYAAHDPCSLHAGAPDALRALVQPAAADDLTALLKDLL